MRTEPGVTHVYRTFNYSASSEPGAERRDSIRIDVVAQHGKQWIKVKASALKGLRNELCEEEDESESDEDREEEAGGQGKEESIPDFPIYQQARTLLTAAEQNLIHYHKPTIVMKFLADDEVDERIQNTLRSMGIVVEVRGEGYEAQQNEQENISPDAAKPNGDKIASIETATSPSNDIHPDISSTLNLDVTTLIALVTDITHRLNSIPLEALDIPPLQLQQSQEHSRPLLPLLHSLLSERKLVTTQTALRKFVDIVKLLGGPTEKARAKALIDAVDVGTDIMAELDEDEQSGADNSTASQFTFAQIRVIEDYPSERFLRLLDEEDKPVQSGRLQKHHIVVFGTGDRLRATTITANAWVERALVDIGLGGLSLWMHEPRSLVEKRVGEWRKKAETSSKNKLPSTSETPKPLRATTHFRCKKCRTVLISQKDMVSHEPGAGQSAFNYRKRSTALPSAGTNLSQCNSYHIEAMDWIKGVNDGAMEGKIVCPNAKCGVKLGSWSWAGEPCSCGAWVAPCFAVHKGKVDETVVVRGERV